MAFSLAPFYVLYSTQNSAMALDGTASDPFQESRGKLVVLVFVRTDCPVSNRYAPAIQRISAKYEGQAAFWLVYPDRSESAEKIRQHEREYKYKLPALRDPQLVLVKLAQARVTPEVAVFDASRHLAYHGRIDNLYQDLGRARHAPTTHELEEAIQAVLNGRTPPASAPGAGCFISDLE
ncbi:MAG TPA: redoxin domain-containing protein [Candidatus Cybelea sp.]|nr:redoxin domain-containing protein [Candidatus Cybelea sp.]